MSRMAMIVIFLCNTDLKGWLKCPLLFEISCLVEFSGHPSFEAEIQVLEMQNNNFNEVTCYMN